MSIKQEINKLNTSPKELSKFGYTIGIVLILIAAYFYIMGNRNTGYFIAGFSSLLILFALIKPEHLKNIYKAWMAFAISLSWVMTRVILGILFYVGFTLIKVVAKIAGKEFLDLKIDKNRETYWIKREKKDFDKNAFERQF